MIRHPPLALQERRLPKFPRTGAAVTAMGWASATGSAETRDAKARRRASAEDEARILELLKGSCGRFLLENDRL